MVFWILPVLILSPVWPLCDFMLVVSTMIDNVWLKTVPGIVYSQRQEIETYSLSCSLLYPQLMTATTYVFQLDISLIRGINWVCTLVLWHINMIQSYCHEFFCNITLSYFLWLVVPHTSVDSHRPQSTSISSHLYSC